MKLTEHAKIRYVQRVLKIENEEEAKQYVKENELDVFTRMYKMYTNSTLIYKHYPPTGGSGSVQNIYLNKNIIIVMSAHDEKIITIYHVTVDLDKDKNEKRIREILNEVLIKENEVKRIVNSQDKHNEYSRQLEFMIDRVKHQLQGLTDELDTAISKGKDMREQLKETKNESRNLMTELLYGFKKFDPSDRDY